jgi:hypothetical protein
MPDPKALTGSNAKHTIGSIFLLDFFGVAN